MARCRCDPDTCACAIRAGQGIVIAGEGDAANPWVISAIPSCVLCQEPGEVGWVLTRTADGTYVPMPPPGAALCIDCGAAANAGDALLWNSTAGLYQPGPVPQGAQGPPGAAGPPGAQGPPGESVQIMGSVPGSGSLTGVSNPAEGDGWIAQDTGHLWVFTGPPPNDSISKWTDVGQIVGPPGATGPRGSLWYSAGGVPGTIAGVLPNDQYLDTATGDVYQWAA